MTRALEQTIAAVGVLLALVSTGCRQRVGEPKSADAGTTTTRLLAGVVDPWSWPRAGGATDVEKAIENIGPYEIGAVRGAGAQLPVNTNARYWTSLVGIAWTRDVRIDFDDEPVDLDGDRVPDTRITRHVNAPGGVLANPELFGLVRTPGDPRGKVGRVSVSTGLLGLREALDPSGRPTGEIGMTCFLCHGGVDPREGQTVLGLPGASFDYGLLLATAAVLDPNNRAMAEFRRARGYPDGRTVQARLLLAGPGRQDLTGEFGLDVTVPGYHSARYAGARRIRQGTKGIVNPISVPGILAAAAVDLQNWSGSEVASPRWLARLAALAGGGPATRAGHNDEIWRALELPPPNLADLRESAATRRALMMDLRNLGTLGLQQDSFPGLLWADAIYGKAELERDHVAAIPRMYAAGAVRRVVAAAAEDLAKRRRARKIADGERERDDAAAIARGREIFTSRPVGIVANRQVLKELPPKLAALKIAGPVIAPIDEALPAVFPVTCADCHNATPAGPLVTLHDHPPPLGRCSHCHRAHQAFDGAVAGAGAGNGNGTARRPLTAFAALIPKEPPREVAFCAGCHQRHRSFEPMAYSSSLLLPFDANGNGKAQGDEAHDERAGAIGTESLLAFDVPRPDRPEDDFALDLPELAAVHAPGPVRTVRTGVSWVRVPPLFALVATAPYLHNGSVPTLPALLDPVKRRPVTFPLGRAGFVFDTRIAGNRNIGHAYGTTLSTREKADLVAFLQSL